ncbi:MAG: alpha-glucan family phosphorylase [Acidobacteria bacterium]|nr:alpha-glucan family phosphorylase [Acidobacteriota bacterium]MBI3655937.1 alpha-glucan family phosphorylase [Acidobacteriota bacterium]
MSLLIHEFTNEQKIAYYSMEIGLRSDMSTYSGGLGVLAGDTIKSAADLRLPMVAVSILTKKGYFKQELDKQGRQIELPDEWDPSQFMAPLKERVRVYIEDREVLVGSWLYVVKSAAGGKLPIIFLDTDLPENLPQDRELTHYLYGGDLAYRLKQEIILGIGGTRMLDKLGFSIKKYHMNEGHSALLTLELLRRYKRSIDEVWDERSVWDVEKVRKLCVFTTHTPVEAGHDKFDYDLVEKVMGAVLPIPMMKSFAGNDKLNMTLLGLNLSHYINGVAKKHGEVSQGMFPGYEIHAITNGVHSFTWVCDSMKALFDKYLAGWANEPEIFVRAGRISDDELWAAHMEAKRALIDYVNQETQVGMEYDVLTVGYARRATAYKRADLLFSDIERFAAIGKGKLQIIYAGKAHPKDDSGKRLIARILEIKEMLKKKVRIVFLKNYNMDLALKLVSGVDVWLNTPQRPLEASGTSGMKAAHNGVPNFSVLDGWWIEGHIEGFTGWAIGPSPDVAADPARDADDLYEKLENVIIPTYYNNRTTWIRIMNNAISQNANYFNTNRMMRRYVTEAYIR